MDLEIKNIETTIEDTVRYLRILRMDFKAQIITAGGELKKKK